MDIHKIGTLKNRVFYQFIIRKSLKNLALVPRDACFSTKISGKFRERTTAKKFQEASSIGWEMRIRFLFSFF
jgi:hypothetical protein